MAKAVATTTEKLPSKFEDRYKEDAGAGVSERMEDRLVPWLVVLQKLSPQVEKRDDAYIAGAEPGQFWLRNHPYPLKDKISFQPSCFNIGWAEWKPDRGGFVARHTTRPKDARNDGSDGSPNWRMPNGNIVEEVRYFYGHLIDDQDSRAYQFVIPFRGAGHQVAKDWNNRWNFERTLAGVLKPAWAFIYTLTTKITSNTKGEWFAITIAKEREIDSEEEYNRGKQLRDAVVSGQKVVAEEEQPKDEVPF